MELEKAIKRCEELIKAEHFNWIGLSNQEAIETVLKALENSIEKIEKFYNGEIFTAKQLKFIEQQQKQYFIHKKVIENKIEELKNMNVDGEVFTTAVNFAIKVLQELLEGD